MHRIMLVGPDPTALKGYETALARAGQTVTSSEGAQHAAAIARRFMPSVLILVVDLNSSAGRENLAGVLMHPATSALPVICLTKRPPIDVAIAAFRTGICDVVLLPTKLDAFLAQIFKVLGPEPGHALTRLAMDRSGPAMLKRIGNYIRANGCTVTLQIHGAPSPAGMRFVDGNIVAARFGTTSGSGAIQRLLTEATQQPWQVNVFPSAASAPAAATPAPTAQAPTPKMPLVSPSTPVLDLSDSGPALELDPPSTEQSWEGAPTSTESPDDISLDDEAAIELELDVDLSEEAATIVSGTLPQDAPALFDTAPKATHAAPPPLAQASQAQLDALPPMRVLLTDDDASLLMLYAKFLSRAGWTVETAADGAEGYERALAMRPDAIVSDIMMPEVDGWGFLSRVRSDARLLDTKFLLLSCHGEYLNRLKSLDAGADDYLEKGIRGDMVVQRVAEAAAAQRNFQATVQPGLHFGGALGPLGIRFVLLNCAAKQLSGHLDVEDRWAKYSVQLDSGMLVAAQAVAGNHVGQDHGALRALLGVGEANYVFVPENKLPPTQCVIVQEEVDAIATELNQVQAQAEEQIFAGNSKLETANAKLAELYLITCPDPVRSIATALVEGTPPRELLANADASPLVIEWTVKDLLRKGIARFGNE